MDTALLALKVAVSLGVVLAFIWVVQRRLTKIGALKKSGHGRRAADLTVVARKGLGGKASVVIVDVEGERLVLGVTEQNVSVLTSGAIPVEEPVLELVAPVSIESAAIAPATVAPAAFAAELAKQEQDVPAQAEPSLQTAVPTTAAPTADGAEPLPMRPRDRARRTPVVPTQQQLQGSILSAETWRQAAAAMRSKRAG
jgi:flagellar protein FliO/FliZ